MSDYFHHSLMSLNTTLSLNKQRLCCLRRFFTLVLLLFLLHSMSRETHHLMSPNRISILNRPSMLPAQVLHARAAALPAAQHGP
jgi:hypothetical protein